MVAYGSARKNKESGLYTKSIALKYIFIISALLSSHDLSFKPFEIKGIDIYGYLR
jgi:hypothetical protein